MKLLFFLLFSTCYCYSQIDKPAILQQIGSGNKSIEIKGGVLQLDGDVDFKGKSLLISKDARITGGVIRNAIIEASKEQVLFDRSVELQNVKSSNGIFYATWFGADPTDGQPDDNALQKGLDYVIKNDVGLKTFELSPGTYILNKGLVVWRDQDKNGSPEFVNIRIRGTIGAYMGTSNEVTLLCKHVDGFGLAIQRGKGIIVENINIQGQNQLNYSISKALDPASNYLLNKSLRTNVKSPYAGLVLDFAGSSVEGADRYPGFESYYSIQGNGGSTDCKFYNVTINGFVAGIILSPNTNTQNNEAHLFDGIWISNCRDGFVTTNSQERTVQCKNFKFWNSVRTCFRTNGYGMNRGEVPQIESMNAAGVFELFNFGGIGGYFPIVNINTSYAENFYWIGNVHGITVQFNACHFAFAVLAWIDKKTQDFIITGSQMMFFNCILISYGEGKVPYNIRGRTKFTNCYLQNPVAYKTMNWTLDFYEVEYENCKFYTEDGFVSDGSFESHGSNYVFITYGAQKEFAGYNKEYASYKGYGFSQYRKVKSPLVRQTIIASQVTVTVSGNKAKCNVRVPPGTLIYTQLYAHGDHGYACMRASDSPYVFTQVISSMVTGTYDLYSITVNSISPVGFCDKKTGKVVMERGKDGGPCTGQEGTIICNYEYDEYGFCDQDPLTSDRVPNGVAFTKGAVYKNQTGSAGLGWICTKSGVKGSSLSPTFRPL